MFSCTLDNGIALEEVITRKSKIEFCVKDDEMWYTTVVDSVKGNEIIIAFPEMFAAVKVILADSLFCRFSDNNYQYDFECEIDFIRIRFPQQIRLKLTGQVQKHENLRKSVREGVLFPAYIFTEKEQIFTAYVNDVSSTGVRVVSKYDVGEDSDVSVDIVLPVRNIFDSTVRFKGRVMWTRGGYRYNEYGIDITEMDNTHRKRIEQFMAMHAK